MSENSDFNDQAKTKGKLSVAKKIGSVIDAVKGIVYGFFTIKADAVYLQRPEDKNPVTFCSYIKPLAICRTAAGIGYAVLFEMRDLDGRVQQFILRSEDFQTGGGELPRVEFARRGGWTNPHIRTRTLWPDFFHSILKQSKPLPRLTLSTKNGWHVISKKFVYILPGEVIGNSTAETVIHPDMPNPADHAPAGTLATWQREVARYAATNSRLALALCTSLTGPVLAILQAEPGIIHIFGASSIAKTTALFMALSPWGNPRETLKTWNSTGNALVALLSQHNDGLLALDEQALCTPEQAGHTVYAWTTGTIKSRLKKDSTLQETEKFCTMGLSTGEQTLSDFMRQSRHKLSPAAGQEVRMLDVPADPGAGLGLFQDLCGFENGAALSNHLKYAATQNHGAAIRAFLKRLVEDRNERPEQLHETLTGTIKRFMAEYLPTGADGQVHRACHRFGIIAAAGELAASYGVLPFPDGDAAGNIGECFNAWLSRRGTSGQLEISRLLDQVAAFFDRNGESCFISIDANDDRTNNKPVQDCYGFKLVVKVADSTVTRTEFFVMASRFKELVTGFDSTWAAKQLADNGIIRGAGDRPNIVRQLPGKGSKCRVYHFYPYGETTQSADIALADIPF